MRAYSAGLASGKHARGEERTNGKHNVKELSFWDQWEPSFQYDKRQTVASVGLANTETAKISKDRLTT